MNSRSKRRLLALIVDDEVSLRRILSRFLGVLGIDWIDTDDESALEMFLDLRSRLHVVFLDVEMPRVDGYTLFRQIRNRSPTMSVVFCTSTPVAEVLANVAWDDDAHYLAKPYTRRDLEKLLATVGKRHASMRAAQDSVNEME